MSILKQIAGLINDKRVLQAQAYVGTEFQSWKNTDVGKYLITKIEQEEVALLRDLSRVDPYDTIKVIQAQERAALMTTLLRWIEDAINTGEAAKFQLAEMDASEMGY